jgi:phosphate/sulfate permease
MSLLNELKKFISKWIKNPIVLGIVAYLIYKILQKYIKKESVNLNKNKIENIHIIQRKDNEEVIYDTNTNMYAHIIGDEIVATSNKKIEI